MSMASKSDKHDVMISYSGRNKNKEKVFKIRDNLKRAGLTYWIDKEHMSGCIYEAMSKAVENCSIFLMCYSKEYFESEPCKTEATYAADQKKIIIPCRMEADYNPTGWLGLLISNKLYFDFSGKYPFKEKVGHMLREIKTRLHMGRPDPLTEFSKSCTTSDMGHDDSDSDETSGSGSEESSEEG